jgi:hypothetical protein
MYFNKEAGQLMSRKLENMNNGKCIEREHTKEKGLKGKIERTLVN